MNYQELQKESLGRYCRNCLNQTYHLNLERRDCIYIIYPRKCSCCGEMKNNVEHLTWTGRLKVFFRGMFPVRQAGS